MKRNKRLGPTNWDRILSARHAYMKSINYDLETFARHIEESQRKLIEAGKVTPDSGNDA